MKKTAKKRLAIKINDTNITENSNEYNTEQLNWRDDGDELTDPSVNDFLKGYNIDPYEFQQWASIKHKQKFKTAMKKTASGEVFIMQFSPEFLADRILTLWNGADGPLQNFFEAFTLRYNNALKMQVAKQLARQGYQVYPFLTDDKPRYAKRLEKLMTKIAKSKNLDNIIHFATNVSRSDNVKLLAGELTDLKDYHQSTKPISLQEANSILKYYEYCFPKDYAIKLIRGLITSPKHIKIDFTKINENDWDFSDESLKKIEDYMSGNADPMYRRDGGSEGWNFTTDMRNFDGTRPERYEITGRLLKKKKIYHRADFRKKKRS